MIRPETLTREQMAVLLETAEALSADRPYSMLTGECKLLATVNEDRLADLVALDAPAISDDDYRELTGRH